MRLQKLIKESREETGSQEQFTEEFEACASVSQLFVAVAKQLRKITLKKGRIDFQTFQSKVDIAMGLGCCRGGSILTANTLWRKSCPSPGRPEGGTDGRVEGDGEKKEKKDGNEDREKETDKERV